MSRWRPPQARSSPYITAAGYAALEAELKELWKKRRVVNDALAAAAAEGDRSENAEYIYRKKEQAGIDRRIRYLQKRMPDLSIVAQVGDKSKVYFGATVTLLDESEIESELTIVGADETDIKAQRISIDSPLARAVLKKEIGDEVVVHIADKQKIYEILDILYKSN